MGFNCGIIGLPNVGKSTLFNALTKTEQAEAANYPFCTIEPNVGRASVLDERLDVLASYAKSQTIIPARVEFVDIAGLVRGASKGEGLGNQFLGNIRRVDATLHVVRCFEDSNVVHVEGRVDPVDDIQVINTELLLSDISFLERRDESLQKKAKSNDKEALKEREALAKIKSLLEEGQAARIMDVDEGLQEYIKSWELLTAKPVVYVCNMNEDEVVSGNKWSEAVEAFAAKEGADVTRVSAAIEMEMASLSADELKDFLETLGWDETGLSKIARAGYHLLDLITFFTVGPQEAHAWPVKRGVLAPQAAGVIHTDFEKGFIRAETISYQDYIDHKGESGAKAAGKIRMEGKDYTVQDGDIFHFHFN